MRKLGTWGEAALTLVGVAVAVKWSAALAYAAGYWMGFN